MKVIDVFPPAVVGVRPRCEAILCPQTANHHAAILAHGLRSRRAKSGIKPFECDTKARYYVNGKWLCRKHAAYELLDSLAVDGDRATAESASRPSTQPT